MAMKQLTIPLCDIRQNPPEEVLSLCKNSLLFSELFGECRVLLRKCQIQEDEEDYIHVKKKVLRDEEFDVKHAESELDGNASDEEAEESIHDRKRVLRNLENEEAEEPIHDRKRVLRNLENVKYAERESDDWTSEKKHKRGPKRKIYSAHKHASLSDYEKMIAEKNKERLALLSSLGVIQAKDDFCEMVNGLKPKPVKRVIKVQWPSEPQRSSQRLAQQTGSVDFSEESLYERHIEKTNKEEKKEILKMSFKTTLMDPEMYETYLEYCNFQNPIAECENVYYDENVLKNMALSKYSISQGSLYPTVLAWYPSSEDLILTVGSRYGSLSILNLGSESDPYLFKPHVRSITNLLFNPLNRVHMVSSSSDGSVQCADLVKHTFTKIYKGTHATAKCSYFDFLSLTTCLVADHDGEVTLIDYRTNRITGEMKHQCHTHKINTVHVHPVHKHNFVTAGTDSSIHLWDLRMLQKTPATYDGYNSSVLCAYFSPDIGNSILSASPKDIRIIDSESMTPYIRMLAKETLHFQNAKWLPHSPSMYVLNCSCNQNGIEVYDKDTKMCHKIKYETLHVRGNNTFHPCKPVLAGIRTDYDVFVFSYKS